MSEISRIDKNFEVKSEFEKEGFVYYNVRELPFKVYGLMHENGKFTRMPEDVAKSVSEGVFALYHNTAGGRVRFKTNSDVIRISAKMHSIGKMPHFALTGSAGFDLYSENQYIATFIPPFGMVDGYESEQALRNGDMQNITINFPTYSGVNELYIGIKEGSLLEAADEYKFTNPIVYYGSSITQGGCCSRPGNTYQAVISRWLNADYINLGFSGNAKAEDEIADYIKNLEMSVFVYDYDHNAPSVEHLRNTHEKMFKKIRAVQPELPVVMVSRPRPYLTEAEFTRKEIIKNTYNSAVAAGDKNVYFIDGQQFFNIFGDDSGSVDGCHPNDLGFMCMAKSIGDVLAKIIL